MAQAWYNYPVFQGNAYQVNYLGPGTDTPHYAYDVQTPFHTPITAPIGGTIEVADYQPWGGEIFVKPDDPTLPEYYFYHPDQIDVVKGQHVGTGQELALSGGENPGYPGAEHPASTQYSSGPHTHMGWFTKFVTVPQTGETIPYGPDTASLLQIAKSGAVNPFLDLLNNNSTAASSALPTITPAAVARIGIGAAGVLLIGIGVISALYATGAVDKATGLAKKAAKLAVLA